MLNVTERELLHGAGEVCPVAQTLTLPKDCCEKLADTFIAEVIETVHVGVVPEHAPPQPRNVDPAAGLADSVTLEPVK
jgi:hypothetical protein